MAGTEGTKPNADAADTALGSSPALLASASTFADRGDPVLQSLVEFLVTKARDERLRDRVLGAARVTAL